MSSRYCLVSWPSMMPLPKLASRALLSMMPMNNASNCTAASAAAFGSSRAARCLSSASPCMSTAVGTVFAMSDHDELRAQRARFAQGFEDRHEVARRGAHLIYCLDDLVERGAGLEHEHPSVAFVNVDVGLAHDRR